MRTNSQAMQTALLSIIPGGGQFKNGQNFKAGLFFAAFLIFLVEMLLFGGQALYNFVTLGSVPMEDNSLFLLIEGTLQVIVTVIFIIFWVLNIKDAYQVRQSIEKGFPVAVTRKEFFKKLYEDGFAYLLTIPAYLVMIVAIIFPVMVTLFMAFTNYDFRHIPPANLIDWIGFSNFTNIFTLSSYRDTFVKVFSWTVIWTVLATTLQITLGILTAVVANQKFVKFRRVFGVIFLLPWAVPAFITIMSFSNMFNDTAGAINTQVIPL